MIPSDGVPKSYITGVAGWHTDAETDEFMRLAKAYVSEGGVVVEVGSEYGRTMSEIGIALEGLNKASLYSVDLFPNNHPMVGDLLAAWQRNLDEAWLSNRLTLTPVRGDSVTVAKTWAVPIDMLIIDADHTYEGASADIGAWAKFVKVGGVVVFHDVAKDGQDCHYLHHEVRRAVDEWWDRTAWQRFEGPDSITYFVRPVHSDNGIKLHVPLQVETLDQARPVSGDFDDAPVATKPVHIDAAPKQKRRRR